MKRKNKIVSDKPVETVDTLIGVNSILQGDLEFTGGLRIDGHIKGHITALDANNGTLVLSEAGQVEGNINVPHVIVNGKVKGNINSSGHVELQNRCEVYGDVHYKAVEMELGASINGSLVCDPGMPAYDSAAKKLPTESLEDLK